MEQDITLHIGRLNETDRKLMEIIMYTFASDKKDNYKKLADIFSKRFEMAVILEDINSSNN